MLTRRQHKLLVKSIEQLALEHIMYHVEKDRYLFEYAPCIVNYHKRLIDGSINETFNYDYFLYSFDTILTENINTDLFKHGDIKAIEIAKNISKTITNRVVNGYLFKPNHIYESCGILKIDWNKFNLSDHIKFLKESIENEAIAICDHRVMKGFWDGSHHIIKENKSLIKEGNSMGCNKKEYKYARKAFESVSKEVSDILKANDFIIEGIYDAGSLRRKKSLVGDLDLIVNVLGHKHIGKINSHPLDEKRFAENYQFLFANTLKRNISSNKKRSFKNIVQFVKEDMQCDVFLCTPTSIPTRRCYWTGSAAHNTKMLYEGFKRDVLFSFDYLYDKKRNKFLMPKNEKQIFSVLGVDYVKPEDRK